MPSYWTHLAFAHDCSQRLFRGVPSSQRGELTRAIAACPHMFCSGTQGPDPFLFYLPVYWSRDKLSSILHTQKTPQMLCQLLRRAYAMEGKQRQMALSYAAGFLAHYMLDSHTHAFVYAKTGVNGGADSFCNHNALESDLNRLAIQRSFGKTAREMPPPRGYELSKEEKEVLCILYSHLFQKLYGVDCSPAKVARALWSARTCYRTLYDPRSRKGALLQKVEALLGRAYLSPICLGESHYYDDPANQKHQPWVNPFTGEVSSADFFRLYDLALERYAPLIRALEAPAVTTAAARDAILNQHCRRDFHGAPISS